MDCTRLNEAVRAPLRALGERLVEQGTLTRWEDLLLVSDDEADAFLADPASYAATIAERAALLETLKGKEPPFVFEGAPPALSEYRDRADVAEVLARPGDQLHGIGASPGRYTGPARLLSGMADQVDPGDVIVAANTDATWGPLFLAAGAVIVETGSTISHAAIVSRELGIPAALSVPKATTRLRDGMLVTVDGGSGTVLVH